MAEEKKGFFSRLVAGLTKTRNAVVNGLDDIFNGPGDVDDDFYEELEETLITGDIGVRATDAILEDLRAKVKEQHIKQRSECRRVLIDTIKEQMDLGENAYDFEHRKSVLLLVGVNGVGKTTTAGKMAAQYKNQGKRCCWPLRIPSAPLRSSSCRPGQTAPAWSSSPRKPDRIPQPSFLTPALPPGPEGRTS